jgi:hypothetical protein
MALVKQKPLGHDHRKRHGTHHKHSKKYLKVYWPYAPMLLIVALGLFIGSWQPSTQNGVLAYATEMGIDTLLISTNEQRTDNGRPSLKLNDKLSAAAQAKANDMTSRNYWSHTTPDGKDPWVFVQTAGYQYQKAGENLAYGFDSSNDTVVGWMHSAGHRENLLDQGYTEVGFGFANARDYNKSGPETVVVAMYGKPAPVGTETAATTPADNADGKALPANSLGTLTPSSQAVGVSHLDTLTNGRLPWATFAVGLISGLALAIIILRHGLAFRRLIREGEAFFVKHPVLDIVLTALVMTGYVLSRVTGVIL